MLCRRHRREEKPTVRRRTALLAAVLVIGLGVAACTDDGSRSIADLPGTVPSSALPSPVLESSEPSPSPASASPTPSPSPTKPAPPPYDVKAVQKSLTALKYYIGAVDGERGSQLRSAVMAFQKVQGIPADGVIGKATLAALKAPKPPALKATAPKSRVEVDLTKQVLYLVRDGKITRILPVSSGNGKTYLQKDGTKARALTPVGWYKIERRIVGVREADLGTLYDPQYFYKGWAIHGSNSVPARPASHGCVRIPRPDATWLLGQIDVGIDVYLYGGEHTFPAGSKAPGTDNPSGDRPEDTASPTPEPSPSSEPASPSPSPSSTSPSASPSASPLPTAAPSATSRP